LNGRPFQLNELRGKVVLIDFWGTWCPHCMRGIANLVDLQRRYGQHGLEVVGIAYEDDKLSLAQKIEKVNFVRQRQGINYKVLLGAGDDCPVLSKLDVQKFPSLILVDETGHIVWRGEGMTAQNKARLEAELRKRLRE
jgi:thiol-disulfide isomerase/thioredoxin